MKLTFKEFFHSMYYSHWLCTACGFNQFLSSSSHGLFFSQYFQCYNARRMIRWLNLRGDALFCILRSYAVYTMYIHTHIIYHTPRSRGLKLSVGLANTWGSLLSRTHATFPRVIFTCVQSRHSSPHLRGRRHSRLVSYTTHIQCGFRFF